MARKNYCDRDHRGWRIPRAGTKSRDIYECLVQGLTPAAILLIVEGSKATLGVLIWKIKHPEASNALQKSTCAEDCPSSKL